MKPFPRQGASKRLCQLASSHRNLTTSLHNKKQPPPHKPASRLPHGNFKAAAKLAAKSRGDSVGLGHDPKTRLRLLGGKEYSGRHGVFRSTVLHRLQHVLNQLAKAQLSSADLGEDELNRQANQFMDAIDHAFRLAEQNITRRDRNPLFWNLRDAFIQKDLKGLTNEVQYSFQSFLFRQRFSKGIEDSQKHLLDLRFPQEWFPATRAIQRKIHVHVGPTNSGKTYNALKALEASKSGVYAGPLRLLANEVYQRLRAKNLPCALITGEEVRIPEDSDEYFSSCTVEMVPLNKRFDVAVIDEIQMIADAERGNAWTSALLGVQADEVHVCGEDRAVALIQRICASIGDECIIHRYERLSPLKTMDTAIEGDYDKLEKGDAIVAFSRLSLHSIKRSIEAHTGRRCAIVYGSLPPEVRVQQAALFNDPDNDYDFIAASDAIGMGLNLEARRVILEAVTKFDGTQHRLLTYPEIKQIGGRAGRYRSARSATAEKSGAEVVEEKVGYVTTMDMADLRSVRRAFTKRVEDLQHAYIAPPAAVVERFASYFPPGTPLSFIMMRIKATASVSPYYRLNISPDMLEAADIIQDLPLTIFDRLTVCHLPISLRSKGGRDVLRALASVIAYNKAGDLLSIKEIALEILDDDYEDHKGEAQSFLSNLEALHVAVNQYIWLSYRYSGVFRNQELAFHVRTLVEEKLIDTLDRLDFTEQQLQGTRKRKRQQARSLEMMRQGVEDDVNKTLDSESDHSSPIVGNEDWTNPSNRVQQVEHTT